MRSHPRQELGRNDPCPCGSGRKYKRCCLDRHEFAPPSSPWQEQREASDRLTAELIRFWKAEFADDLLDAWKDFNQQDFPQSLEKFPGEEQIFMPYFLFDWNPDSPPARRDRPGEGIVVQAFLARKAHRLGELERAILQSSISSPISFYEVVRSEPGHGFLLRDVLIGEQAEVEEHSGSLHAKVGDILYGQLCRLPQVTTLGRMAPTALRPRRKAELVALRNKLRRKVARRKRPFDAGDLIRFAEPIRTEYSNARDAHYAPPVLTNTDHELIELHTLRYRIGSAQVAFDALSPLAWGQTREELFEEAEIDPAGAMLGVSFQWRKPGNAIHKNWDNTILAHLKIVGRTLTVEVNSAARARKIREEIDKRLGILAVLESSKTASQKQMLENAQERKAAPVREAVDDSPPDPIAQEMVRGMLEEHAKAWVDTPIPVLRGQTPRQAVADGDGREIVEGLLTEWERRKSEQRDPVLQSFDVGSVRKRLGM
jgi:hypothetical protein